MGTCTHLIPINWSRHTYLHKINRSIFFNSLLDSRRTFLLLCLSTFFVISHCLHHESSHALYLTFAPFYLLYLYSCSKIFLIQIDWIMSANLRILILLNSYVFQGSVFKSHPLQNLFNFSLFDSISSGICPHNQYLFIIYYDLYKRTHTHTLLYMFGGAICSFLPVLATEIWTQVIKYFDTGTILLTKLWILYLSYYHLLHCVKSKLWYYSKSFLFRKLRVVLQSQKDWVQILLPG